MQILLSHNLQYLFKLNKEKNNLKIVDFSRKTGINQNTITSWTNARRYPTKSNIHLLVDYFNKNLALNISVEDITQNNLELQTIYVKEELEEYGPDLNKKIIEQIQRLSTKGKKTILDLLKDFE